MANLEFAIVIIVVLTLLLIGAYYALNALVRHRLKSRVQVIARDFTVNDRWLELATEKPAKPQYHMQRLFLRIPNYKFDWRKEDGIKLTDGPTINPEIQIEDEFGRLYNAKAEPSGDNELACSVKTVGNTDRVVVRIRSDEPFQCSSIGWRTKRMK